MISVIRFHAHFRINFTLEDLAPACPAYSYFRKCLSKEYTNGTAALKFSVKQLPTDFIPCFDYDRIKEMVS